MRDCARSSSMTGDLRPSKSLSLRSVARVACILLASGLAMPTQWLAMRVLPRRVSYRLPRWWHGGVRRALGIRVERVGQPRSATRTLYVGNHVSHFDIPLLGSLLEARFIAKDDMQGWPGMRWIGALQRTLFISRRRADAARVATQVQAAMGDGDSLILFAEGTTSSGVTVAPFKSSLLGLFTQAGRDWVLQPFTIEPLAFDGRALRDGGDRDGYAFHGDMDAGAHVLRFLRARGAQVRVTFHAPIPIPADADRKALAAQAHAVVASGLSSERPGGMT